LEENLEEEIISDCSNFKGTPVQLEK